MNRPEQNQHRIVAVIVNWNGGTLLDRCLDSVVAADVRPDLVVLVDNGSKDGAVDRAELRDDIPVRAVRNDENRGFAVACNQGMDVALDVGAEFVFLFNNDALLRADALDRLVSAADRHPAAGLFAGKILLADGARIWCAGVDIGFFPNLQRLRGFMEDDRGQYDSEHSVAALTGCGLLIRRSLLEKVGCFDPDYFVYVEDIDLSTRARKAGMGCVYVPDAVMLHDASSSTGGGYGAWRKYMVAYNVVVYLKKHGTAALWTAFVLIEVLAWPVLFLTAIPRGRAVAALAKARGIIGGLFGRPIVPPRGPASS